MTIEEAKSMELLVKKLFDTNNSTKPFELSYVLIKKAKKEYPLYDSFSIQVLNDKLWLVGHISEPYEPDNEFELKQLTF